MNLLSRLDAEDLCHPGCFPNGTYHAFTLDSLAEQITKETLLEVHGVLPESTLRMRYVVFMSLLEVSDSRVLKSVRTLLGDKVDDKDTIRLMDLPYLPMPRSRKKLYATFTGFVGMVHKYLNTYRTFENNVNKTKQLHTNLEFSYSVAPTLAVYPEVYKMYVETARQAHEDGKNLHIQSMLNAMYFGKTTEVMATIRRKEQIDLEHQAQQDALDDMENTEDIDNLPDVE